jgi:hypothetical protein
MKNIFVITNKYEDCPPYWDNNNKNFTSTLSNATKFESKELAQQCCVKNKATDFNRFPIIEIKAQ